MTATRAPIDALEPAPVRLVTIDVVAEDLGVSKRWIREQVKLGLSHMKFGTYLRFDRGEVRAWVDAENHVPPRVRTASEERLTARHDTIARAGVPRAIPHRFPLMRIPELAEEIGMSERWVREQLKLRMPHFKFGTYVRIDPAEARDWLRERYHVPPVTPAPAMRAP